MVWYNNRKDISVLVGKTIIEIEGYAGGDELIFICDDGTRYKMYHEQDCCESVFLSDVVGEFNDLLNSPILEAEEVSNTDDGPLYEYEEVSNTDDGPLYEYEESYTWTFYKMSTIKGSVTLRWYGSSNGYYSEDVTLVEII